MRFAVLLLVAGCGFQVAGSGGDASPVADTGAERGSNDPPVDAAIDAMADAMIDALVFTPAMCPASYTLTTGSAPLSRYRVITTAASFQTQHADCNDDHAGWTHLVAFDAQAEAGAVGGMTSGFYYIGLVQAPNQTAVAAGWYRFTGGAMASGWSQTGSFAQPEDAQDYVENGQEQLAVADSSGMAYDVAGLASYAAVCECDGHAIDPTVAAMIP